MLSIKHCLKVLRKYFIFLLITSLGLSQHFTIARIHYSGGGDWYSDPSSIPNLLQYLSANTPISKTGTETRIRLTDGDAGHYPYLYLTGHGNIRFTEDEIISLRSLLLNGAFLHADDNYGMDKSFRREMKRVFPNKEFVELPYDHLVFSSYYKFENGLPKVHEHNNRPPQALGLFHNERLILIYTYESDLGDGWEDESVHDNPLLIREAALKMGVNIIYFALTQ
tara:strand:+ start:3484 stop:4155 length:672 start_codon:yes stop_codon:yes gene_type:complete